MRKVDYLRAHIDFIEKFIECHGINQLNINIRGTDTNIGIYNDVQMSLDIKKHEIQGIKDALKNESFNGDISKLLDTPKRERLGKPFKNRRN